MAEQLTDKLVQDIPAPDKGNRITYDTEVKGLGVRVTSAGARAYIFNYRVKGTGTERRITIGDAGNWKLKAARGKAKALKRRVDDGEDPMGTIHAQREAPTVNDLADRFEAEHLPNRREKTAHDYKAMLRLHVRPRLGKTKVAAVETDAIEALHRAIAKTAPYAANRVVALLSKMFALSIRWKMREDNPARGIERSPEQKRKRYLKPAEIVQLSEALAAHPEQTSANAIRLLLLTGARRGEVLSATWRELDLAVGAWTKPSAHTKQKEEHRIPLSAPALQLLTGMKEAADMENERRARDGLLPLRHLFPGKDGKPQGDIKHFWAAVCSKAELTGVRVHDLRHTHALILASLGLSLPIIGALLGHTQAATTHRYAHLMDDPLRAATERLGAIVTGSAKPNAEVVPLMGRRA